MSLKPKKPLKTKKTLEAKFMGKISAREARIRKIKEKMLAEKAMLGDKARKTIIQNWSRIALGKPLTIKEVMIKAVGREDINNVNNAMSSDGMVSRNYSYGYGYYAAPKFLRKEKDICLVSETFFNKPDRELLGSYHLIYRNPGTNELKEIRFGKFKYRVRTGVEWEMDWETERRRQGVFADASKVEPRFHLGGGSITNIKNVEFTKEGLRLILTAAREIDKKAGLVYPSFGDYTQRWFFDKEWLFGKE